jgi:hypothetical protein
MLIAPVDAPNPSRPEYDTSQCIPVYSLPFLDSQNARNGEVLVNQPAIGRRTLPDNEDDEDEEEEEGEEADAEADGTRRRGLGAQVVIIFSLMILPWILVLAVLLPMLALGAVVVHRRR